MTNIDAHGDFPGNYSSIPLITYSVEPNLTSEEFIDCLERSTLAERRPVSDLQTIESMLKNADVICTARDDTGKLIGISRAISDRAFCTYLSDLAVDVAFQKQGIGKALINLTHKEAGLNTMLILLSAPKAVNYYPHIGMEPHPSAWFIPRQT